MRSPRSPALKLCEAYQRQYGARFICAMPTNLYGQHDNYDLHSSHVLPALIRKFHEGRESGQDSVTIWGTGTPLREFLYVDDLAQACVMLMEHPDAEGIYNIGAGRTSPSPTWPRLVAASWATPATSSTTPASPTARRAS